MFVSPRFRDIFSAKPISTRRGDRHAAIAGREAISAGELDRRADEVQINLIWLEIAEAHRKAAMAFTPELPRAEDPASGS